MRERSTHLQISDIEKSERPRARMAEVGAQSLSNAEVISILIGTGVKGENALTLSQNLLSQFGGLTGLQRTTLQELTAVRGIGSAKASRIKAAIEFGRRLSIAIPEDVPAIRSPADAAALVQYEMGALSQEQLRTIHLNTRNQVLGINQLYQGSINTAGVRVGEVFREAIVNHAAAIIVVHNHPSTDPTPSPDDVALTREIVQAGRLLGIDVLDHIIIGGTRFISLKDRGLGFS